MSNSRKFPPDLSNKTAEKPSLEPNPGTLGGEKNTIFASGYFEATPNNFLVMVSTERSSSCALSSKGFNRTNACPVLEPLPDINARLAVKVTFATPGIFLASSCKFFKTLYVLSIDAPGGSETSVKIIPRSSFGINPFGIVEFDHQKNNPPNAKMIKVAHLCLKRKTKDLP